MGFWLWGHASDRAAARAGSAPAGTEAVGTEARDRHIPYLLQRCGLTPRDAEKLNVGHVYNGRRVRDTLVIADSGHSRSREVPLTRGARESIAVILHCTQGQGYPLDLEAPLFIHLGQGAPAGSRMTRFQIQRILASPPV
jgi:hypothetical protein